MSPCSSPYADALGPTPALSAARGPVKSACLSPWWFGRFHVLAEGMAASWAILFFAGLCCGRHQEKAIPQKDQPRQTEINKIIVELAGDDLQVCHKAKNRLAQTRMGASPGLQEARVEGPARLIIRATIVGQDANGVEKAKGAETVCLAQCDPAAYAKRLPTPLCSATPLCSEVAFSCAVGLPCGLTNLVVLAVHAP